MKTAVTPSRHPRTRLSLAKLQDRPTISSIPPRATALAVTQASIQTPSVWASRTLSLLGLLVGYFLGLEERSRYGGLKKARGRTWQ